MRTHLLRQIIRQLILEGDVKNSFDMKWWDDEDKRAKIKNDPSSDGTHHKDNLKQMYLEKEHPYIDELFDGKRDLKRMWNEFIDGYDLRSFWEGPKMKYFHSLSYYGSPASGVHKLSYSADSDEEIQDLSAHGFFQRYNKSGNKDEMSTYGIYNGLHQIPTFHKNFGVLISGRVTLATMDDAFTESRSKATPADKARHEGSGMPKRVMYDQENVDKLLFEEEDIKEFNKIGECIIDNWSIDAIVCNPKMKQSLIDAAETLANRFGVPMIEPKDLGGKK